MRLPSLIVMVIALSTGRVVAQELPRGTILVANMDDDSVWLLDLPTGERRAVVRTHIAPHEIAVSRDGSVAAITNYGDQRGPGNLLQIVQVETGEVTAELTIEGYERLHGAAFLPGDSLLALTSERTGEILIVGLDDGGVRRTLSTGGEAPHMLALGGAWIYAANIVTGSVSRMDPFGDAPTLMWPASTRTEGVAATPDGREVWTGSMDGGSVVGVNGATGEVVARVTGLQVPYRLAVTPDGETVVVSDPEAGALVLIDRASGAVAAEIDIDEAASREGLGETASPEGFVLSRDGQWAFVSTKALNRVAAVHLASRRVVRFFEAGAGPDGIAFSPAGGT